MRKMVIVALAAGAVVSGCSVTKKGASKQQVQTPAIERPETAPATFTQAPVARRNTEPAGRGYSYANTEAEYAEKCMLNVSAPAVYDSLLVNWYEYSLVKSYDDFFKEFVDLDPAAVYEGDVPDSVYRARMRMLVSPISLGYNDVIKSYIVSWTGRNKALVGRILGLGQVYFPMIEEELARQGLPLELKILPVIESALNPTAVSRAGATGLWQFMLATGRSYGLQVTSMVDDRRDPVLATRAAVTHLGDLYKMYGDWTLAIAAYNCGAGNVNKAIARAGEGAQTFWDIYPYLPRETRGYVPSFVAANYAYTFHKQHNIEMTPPPMPVCTDTVTVNRLMHLEQVSSTLDIPIEALRKLNPQYKEDIIPAVERTYSLTLPQPDVSRYLANEELIMAKDSVYLAKYLAQPAAAVKQEVVASSTRYTIKKGDTLGGIAQRHGVTVAQLVRWNGFKNSNVVIRAGQKIEIFK
jgi:membrane-bound lytic murein transglycosylase D